MDKYRNANSFKIDIADGIYCVEEIVRASHNRAPPFMSFHFNVGIYDSTNSSQSD